MRLSSRLALLPMIAALVFIVLTGLLGNWQLNRAGQKKLAKARWEQGIHAEVIGSQELLHQGDCEYDGQMIRLEGEFDHEHSVYLDNRPYQHQAGFYVVTPFILSADKDVALLVNRGWIPRNSLNRERLTPFAKPVGLQTIAVRCLHKLPKVLELGNSSLSRSSPINIAQNIEFETAERGLNLRLLKLYGLELDGDEKYLNDGLVQDFPAPDFGIEKHYGYAFQWFALMITIIIIYCYQVFYKKRNLSKDHE